jgi:Zn-dependent membrane protease YugP
MAIVPMTGIASRILPFAILGGLFFHITGLITIGIWCYVALLVFQLITLPVEFNASHRAKIILQQMGIIQQGNEAAGVNQVLNAAAWTYVAAFIATLGNLLWLLSVRDRRS